MDFFEKSNIKFIPKGTIILSQGEICKFGCKVIAGCLKSYVFDKSGKEFIVQFAPEGWIITDMNSLFNHVPSDITIEAIEDSEVYWLKSKVEDVFESAKGSDYIEPPSKSKAQKENEDVNKIKFNTGEFVSLKNLLPEMKITKDSWRR